MRLKALAIASLLALGASSSAFAQCQGNPPAGRICANGTAAPTLPSWYTGSVVLDRNFGAPSVQGTILNRGASLWSATATPSLGLNGTAGGSIALQGATTGSVTIGAKAAAGTGTIFNLPITNGSLNNVLITDGSGNTSWASAGSGTTSSVGLALPASILTVSGSPVTTTGTLTGTLATQSANLVWAGPTTGSAATPTFRSLVGADLPNPAPSTLGGVESLAAVASNWIRAISTSGVPTASQPAFTDISGTLGPSQCPNPSASTIGCVESLAAVTSKWINTISTAGVPSATQPNFTDLAGEATLAQLPSISNSSVLGNNSGGTAIPSALTASNVLDMINNVQGDVLYRDAAGWLALAPGTNGQVLTSGGAAANPAWATVSGTGTVTSIATNNGVTGGTITTTGTIGLATIASHTLLANITGGAAIPSSNTPSSILDIIGSTTGDILYRSSGSGWQVLAPGSNGQVLTQGASTPAWGSAGTLTNVTIAAGAGIGLTGTCNISTTGTCTVAYNPSTAASVNVVKVQKFTTTGTYTPSTGLQYAIIECIGAGGGGAGAINAVGGQSGGGGGGAGSYSRAYVSAATVGASKAVTIGAAGTAGLATTPWTGGSGGDTSVGALCVGKGGSGGNSNGAGTLGQGGAGGVAGTGDVTTTGQPGGSGISSSIITISVPASFGGSTPFGGGGAQTPGNASHTGDAGAGFGSGGAGGVSFNNGGAGPGGAGAPGLVIVTEYTNQ